MAQSVIRVATFSDASATVFYSKQLFNYAPFQNVLIALVSFYLSEKNSFTVFFVVVVVGAFYLCFIYPFKSTLKAGLSF